MAPRCGKKTAGQPAPRKTSSESKKKKPTAPKAPPSQPRKSNPSEKTHSGVKQKDLNDLIKMVGAMQVARCRENGTFPEVTFKHCGAQIPASLHFFLNDNKYMNKLVSDAMTVCHARGSKNPSSKEGKLQLECANQCEKLLKEMEEDYQYLYEEQESLMSVVRSYLTGSMVRKCDREKNQMAGNTFALIRSYDFDANERRMRSVFLARMFEKGRVGMGDFLTTQLKAAAEHERQQREEAEASANNDGAGINDDLYMAEDIDADEVDDAEANAGDENAGAPANVSDSQKSALVQEMQTDGKPIADKKRGEKRRLTAAEKRAKAHKLMRMQEDVQVRHVECIESEGAMDVRDFLAQEYSRFSAPVIRQALSDLQAANAFDTTVNNFGDVESILDRAHAKVMTQQQQANANGMPFRPGDGAAAMPPRTENLSAAAPSKPAEPRKRITMTTEQFAQFKQRLRQEEEFSDDDDDVAEGMTDEQRKQKLLKEQQEALRRAEAEEEEANSDSRNSNNSAEAHTTEISVDASAAAAEQSALAASSSDDLHAKHGAEGILADLDLSDEELDD